MNSDKYKLKKTLREETALPPELSWQNMEKGILDQMHKQSSGPAPVTSNNVWLRWTLFIAALVVTAVVAFYLGNRSVKMSETNNLVTGSTALPNTAGDINLEESAVSTEPIKSQHLNEISTRHLTPHQIENEAVNTNVLSFQNQRSVLDAKSGESSMATLNPNNSAINDADKTKTSLNHPTNNLIPNEDTDLSASMPVTSIDNHTPITSSQENSKAEPEKQAEVTNLLSTLSFKLKRSNAASMKEIGWVNNAPSRIQKTKLNSIHIGSGVTILNPQFTSMVAGEKFTSLESSVLSQSFFFHYGRQLGKNWHLSSGLEYANYWHRFDFVKETISQKSINNVPVVIHVNAISNDSTFIYGDTIATVKNIRTIRNYNQIAVVSIPLVVSYQKKWNNWSAFSSLGATIQWKKNATGKTLMADKLITYGDTTSIHNNYLGLSLRLEGGLAYDITKNISLTGSLFINQSLNNWSSVAGTTFKPWSMGSNLGLRYRF